MDLANFFEQQQLILVRNELSQLSVDLRVLMAV
jgi:hypothetical protein